MRAFPRPLPAPPPLPEAGERTIAAIDVGSNSVKLLVARAGQGGDLTVLSREKTMARLGEGTLQTGRLSESAIAAGVACITRFAALARAAGAERIVCVATCAVREASNASELARRVKASADVDLEVISGEEEARLITRAVRSDLSASADPLLVIDIGGGSTEVVISRGDRIRLAESLPLGAVRLTDRHGTADRVTAGAARRLRTEVDAAVRRLARQVRAKGFETAVGTSGTILALADAAAALEGRPVGKPGHRTLERKSLRRLVSRLLELDARGRARLPGVEPRRADILPAGGLLLETLLDRFGVKRLVASELSLREGLLLDALGSEARPAARRDVREESVRRLLARSGVDERHAVAVRDLALFLFDQTDQLHQLASREREWLSYATLLHDIGTSIGYPAHHRHSAYLIEHGDLKGFSSEEVEVLAQVARYHRKGFPRPHHEGFQRLDPWRRSIVEKLAAILRLADGLDRTHRQAITGLSVAVKRRRVVVTLQAEGSVELEVWAIKKKAKLFTHVFGKKLEVAVEKPEDASGSLFTGAAGQSGAAAE